MKRKALLMMGIFAVVISLAFAASIFAADVMTITGKVTDENTILADDGEEYTIEDDEKGKELAAMVDKKVKVTGTVEEKEGKKVITVDTFEETE